MKEKKLGTVGATPVVSDYLLGDIPLITEEDSQEVKDKKNKYIQQKTEPDLVTKAFNTDTDPFIQKIRQQTEEYLHMRKSIQKEYQGSIDYIALNFLDKLRETEQTFATKVEKAIKELPVPKDGQTPQKGRDYFTESEIESLRKSIESKVHTPVKGRDYFTSTEISNIADMAQKLIKVPTIEPLEALQIVQLIETLKGDDRLNINSVKGFQEAWHEQAKNIQLLIKTASALNGLNDVNIVDPTNNQVLTYNATDGKWTNQNSQGGGGAVASVNGQTGVVILTTDNITEGVTNQYFTLARVLDTALAGLSLVTATVITATDTVLSAFGKIQAQITANLSTLSSHIANVSNPHSVTKAQVGLGSVVNLDTSTTSNITDSTNKRFVTDANLTVINNTSGVNTGDQTSVSGNAGTATLLQNARNIDGVSFNGGSNITVIAPGTHAAPSKATPVDADELPLVDSASSNTLAKLTWANLKATLKTYFDSLTTTLTNKRINPRTVVAASYTTNTGTSLDVSTCDEFIVTAQAGALKFNNPSGTPVEGQDLVIRIKDNGTARALTYDTQFRASSDLPAPSTTILSKTLYMRFKFNNTDTTWDLLAVLNNF